MSRLVLLALLVAGCGGDGGSAIDAGRDAPARLVLTVDGPATVAATRALEVSVTANGITRRDSFPIGGLPATVDVPQPIQLSMWAVVVDGFDSGGQLIARGTTSLPSGTSEGTITLAPAGMVR